MKLSGLIIETSPVHSTKSARPLSVVKFVFLCDNELCFWTEHCTQSSQQYRESYDEIHHEFRWCGVLSWPLTNHPVTKLSWQHYVRVRYGNPDMQILGTLKIKFQIYRFLDIPSKNLGSDLIFRVVIYWKIVILAELWQP